MNTEQIYFKLTAYNVASAPIACAQEHPGAEAIGDELESVLPDIGALVASEFDKTPKVNIIERGVNRLLDGDG